MGLKSTRSVAAITACCALPALLLLGTRSGQPCELPDCPPPAVVPQTPPPQTPRPPPARTEAPRGGEVSELQARTGSVQTPRGVEWTGGEPFLVSSLAESARRRRCGPRHSSYEGLPPDPLLPEVEPFEGTLSDTDAYQEIISSPHPACAGQRALDKAGALVPAWVPAPRPCRRWPFGEPEGLEWDRQPYHQVPGVALWRGRLWAAPGQPRRSLRFGGYFVALKGRSRQGVVRSITLEPLPGGVSFGRRVERAVYQPPTDYATMWHVVAEVLLPLFHAALPWIQAGHRVAVAQPREAWAKPSKGVRQVLQQQGKEGLSCYLSGSRCLGTPLGNLARKVFSGGYVGLDSSEADSNSDAILFERMIIGTPTNCETVWGSDALFVQAGLGGDMECDRMLWAWRA
eukprot:Hpha_TRINITY_DN31969_c0_g1::TRINITY_DN31969_c0_g1_i1::g.22022::m.22022